MATPNSFRITVAEVFDTVPLNAEIAAATTAMGRDVFSQSIPAADFDIQSFVMAINKRKRVRKTRGKETQT